MSYASLSSMASRTSLRRSLLSSSSASNWTTTPANSRAPRFGLAICNGQSRTATLPARTCSRRTEHHRAPRRHPWKGRRRQSRRTRMAPAQTISWATRRSWGHVPFRARNWAMSMSDAVYALYGERIPNSSDLCCYWFEKGTRAQIEAGVCKRAGLLATQAIRFQSNRPVLAAHQRERRHFPCNIRQRMEKQRPRRRQRQHLDHLLRRWLRRVRRVLNGLTYFQHQR